MSGAAGGTSGLSGPELELGIFECSNGVPKSGDFSVFRYVGGVTFLAGGGIEISFDGGSTLASPLAMCFSGFLAGILAADLSSFTSDVSAFLHPSLYVCLRCLPLQAGQVAYEGLIAVKLWFGLRTELANIMMSKTLWFEVLTGSEKTLQTEQRTSQIVADWSMLNRHAKVPELLNAEKDWNIALV